MNSFPSQGSVVAVCKSENSGIPKLEVDAIQLVENYGIQGDYHAGKYVRHRYLARKDPTQPNLRQVLLTDTNILADLARQGIHLQPGMMGENILLDGISLMTLPAGSQLGVGEATLELTGVRKPCSQLNEMHPRLLEAVKVESAGQVSYNAGMLARILKGGWVRPGDPLVLRTG
jgi:MOSC domain-containing protein YiiM